jgi:hypothetical protein
MKLASILFSLLIISSAAGHVWAQEVCTDSIFVEVDGNLVRVLHTGALYNCCPEFEYTVSQVGTVIEVIENETFQGCYCVCCIDLSVDIGGVTPGEYVLEFHWFDYEANMWIMRALELVVPDQSLGYSDPHIVDHTHSDCYDWTPVPGEEGPSSWGMIKVLYM